MSRIPAVPRLKSENVPAIAILAVLLAILGNMALAAQDKYAVQVPGGLAFSEFKGYEDWQSVSVVRAVRVNHLCSLGGSRARRLDR
jgi:hypothetical protein